MRQTQIQQSLLYLFIRTYVHVRMYVLSIQGHENDQGNITGEHGNVMHARQARVPLKW